MKWHLIIINLRIIRLYSESINEDILFLLLFEIILLRSSFKILMLHGFLFLALISKDSLLLLLRSKLVLRVELLKDSAFFSN